MIAHADDTPDLASRYSYLPGDGSVTPSAPYFASARSLDEAVSGASRRLRALATLSGSLTDPLGPEEAARLVEKQALSALGATSAVVVTLGAFPPTVPPTELAIGAKPTLSVVQAIGLPAEVRAALDALPLDAPVPLAEVASDGRPRFLASEEALRAWPQWGAAMIAAGTRSAAIVPVWANGELRGVLGLAWAEPRVFDEDERAFVLTLGVMCAQAIMRSHLRAAELSARHSAERANESKARFVATISHELRTPMTAVMGYAQLIEDGLVGPVSELQKAHLGRVRASGHHLLGLIDDLLGYARVEAGAETVDVEGIVLDDLVEQCLVMVGAPASRKGIGIRVLGKGSGTVIRTDLRKLRQVLVNVIANAVKYTDEGEIVLALRLDGPGSARRVHLEVTDRGRGISREEALHVFEPFWRADGRASADAKGTGLGLWVALQLARLLGGDITVGRSALGEGSTFVVTVPVTYRPADAAHGAHASPPAVAGQAAPAAPPTA
jgi:signal transduction histidine kinase